MTTFDIAVPLLLAIAAGGFMLWLNHERKKLNEAPSDRKKRPAE